jgi:DNA methyltransferase 1-associated protein 1
MADVKDILGVPRGQAGEERKPEQKAKPERMKRPEGMSREAFALLGGSNPVIPSQLLDGLKKKDKLLAKPKPSTKGTVIYRLKPFINQARDDHLQLVHWVKGYKDANNRIRDAQEGDYPFAKYNKKVSQKGSTNQSSCMYSTVLLICWT